MIFDSVYDIYRGVITYVRVVDGRISARDKIKMMSTGATHELLEIGVISPEPKPVESLGVGEVGYFITGVKDVRQSRVGDTVTLQHKPATESIGGYRDPKPMVYSGLYPIDGSEYPLLREALDKLLLNDAALIYEPETSAALGFGFRVGFLGLLHLEIVRERLEREAGISLISTAPNVVYRVIMEDGTEITVTNPSDWPAGKISHDLRAGRQRHDHRAQRLHRRDHGALPGPPRPARRHGLPVGVPRRAALHAAARRDHLRLLRRPEVAHPRLRLASTTPRPASRSRRWSRSTSCCRARRSTPSARSCTRTRPTATAC